MSFANWLYGEADGPPQGLAELGRLVLISLFGRLGSFLGQLTTTQAHTG